MTWVQWHNFGFLGLLIFLKEQETFVLWRTWTLLESLGFRVELDFSLACREGLLRLRGETFSSQTASV
jgi:hypothetical protein